MSQDWKKLCSSSQLAAASMIMGILNENGITAKILNKQDSSFVFMGKVEVHVPSSQFEAALAIIKELSLEQVEL